MIIYIIAYFLLFTAIVLIIGNYVQGSESSKRNLNLLNKINKLNDNETTN
jgi:hypothetical protein